MEEIKVEQYEMTYRKFRWTIEVPGLPPWILTRADRVMVDDHPKLDITFYYVNDMEPGVCPVSERWPAHGVLKLLDENGTIIRTCEFEYYLAHYIPIVSLDYKDDDFIQGQVRLGIRSEKWR